MRQIFHRYPNKTRRAIEIAIPVISWLLITLPLWLSLLNPSLVAYIIITFDIYWFWKSCTLAINAIRSYISFGAYALIDWREKASQIPGYETLYHAIIIPEFKEPIHILKRTLTNLTKQDFPKERLIVVLATESLDPTADETAHTLSHEYGTLFGSFLVTKHALTTGEIAGKSSNMAYAGRMLDSYIQQRGISASSVIVTSCDADALLHPKHLSCVSYHYLIDPQRALKFFQGAIMFYSNIWRIPLPSRVLNTTNSIWNLALLSQERTLINFSTYSISFQTVKDAGYWATDVIPEDYHLFFRVFFRFGSGVKTKGIFLPVLVDAAESHTFWKTMVNQYEQSKRWAWGVSDIPYVIRGMFLSPSIPLFDRIKRSLQLLEQHIFWPTNWFLLTLGSIIPPLINPAFDRTALGHNLSQLSSGILTISSIFLIIVIILDWKLKPPQPKGYPKWMLPVHILQWFALPFFSFFLSALPGLDAHTRLLIGKRLEYRVTEKV